MTRSEVMSPDLLKKMFSYDESTGVITRNSMPPDVVISEKERKRYNTIGSGKQAGSLLYTATGVPSKVQISLMGYVLSAHRVIWTMVYGSEPSSESFIDHINGNPFDNRLSNLRLCSNAKNQWNRLVPSNSSTGITGVTWSNPLSKWKGTIRKNGKYFHLGYFDTKGMAAVARAKASIRLHGRFSPYCRHVANTTN